MKKRKRLVVLFFSLFLITLVVPAGAEDVEVEAENKSVISVRGEGKASVEPDTGYINFSIVDSGDDVVNIYRENVKRVDEVVEALMEYGLDREDIKTESFDVTDEQRYLPPEKREEDPRLVVNTGLKVVVDDIEEKMGEVLDVAMESGANRVQSIRFDVKDPEAHYYDALEKALENAEKKGERIADYYQLNLGKVKEVDEDPGRGVLGRGGLEMSFGVEEALEADEAAMGETLPVEPGEISFESYVQVKYELN